MQQPKISKLWGVEQPTGFHRIMITLVVYKDLTGFGFQKILRLVNVGFHVVDHIAFLFA